jgi:serine/threonine-protein kinase
LCPFDGADLVDRGDGWLGRTLGALYTLDEVIGEGSIAVVFGAQLDERRLAVKVLREKLASNEEHRRRFLREARAVARVQHPGLVPIVATSGDNEETAYLVMERISGASLGQLLAGRGRLAVDEALEIARGIVAPLAAAHEKGVIHRDLKPSNVLVEEDGRGRPIPRIVDFGLASVSGEVGLTATGDIVGTPLYMSPEQVRGDKPSPSVDHYAMGSLLFEMLEGEPPFTGSVGAVLDAHLLDAPRAIVASASSGLDLGRVVASLLAKDTADRRVGWDTLLSGAIA